MIISHLTVFTQTTSFLVVSKRVLNMDAYSNITVEFTIISNVDWKVTSSESWVAEMYTRRYFTENGQRYVTQWWSGGGPDIGAFEYEENWVSGHDTAFVRINAYANQSFDRTTVITVSGTGVNPRTILLIQTGEKGRKYINEPPIIPNQLMVCKSII